MRRIPFLKTRAKRFKSRAKNRHCAENVFRNELLSRGVGYRLQKVISNMIVDFYFPRHGIIVEIDGPEHIAEKDSRRDMFLNSLGFKVLRFKNKDVFDNASICVDELLKHPESDERYQESKRVLSELNRKAGKSYLLFSRI